MTATHHPLIPLSAPVPPQLEQALGYDGEAHYVAFYWTPCGDELVFDDGQVCGDGNWQGWQCYCDHSAVAYHLSLPCWRCGDKGTTNQLENEPCEICDGAGIFPLNLGSSDEEAECWLIIDRQKRQAYIADPSSATSFLQAQWPTAHELTHEEQLALIHAMQKAIETFEATWQPPSEEEILADLERLHQVLGEMTAWLNEH